MTQKQHAKLTSLTTLYATQNTHTHTHTHTQTRTHTHVRIHTHQTVRLALRLTHRSLKKRCMVDQKILITSRGLLLQYTSADSRPVLILRHTSTALLYVRICVAVLCVFLCEDLRSGVCMCVCMCSECGVCKKVNREGDKSPRLHTFEDLSGSHWQRDEWAQLIGQIGLSGTAVFVLLARKI